ncbi:hypothetical protein CDD81_605 [Ophiocordyceps australis]|uniref:THO complex subunit 2 n=1 Tax=Ophiocordyceps australis TaxID=1399860 RepID=A0A2C5YF25_9HYPO|nr:hypothetical protein CDD81_605 [Ophiocordyceps australis]
MPPKRKRSDRPSFEGSRPSPHRPADAPMAQHDREDLPSRSNMRGRTPRASFSRRDSANSQSRPLSNSHGPQSPPSLNLAHPHQNNTTPTRPQSASHQAQPLTAKQPATSQAAATKQSSSPTAPAPPGDGTSPKASTILAQYFYDNLTDDKVRGWAEKGRQEIIQHGVQSREDVDITELSSLFQEFVHAVLEGRLGAADAGACVREILGEETTTVTKDSESFAPHTLLLDSLAIVMDNKPDLYQPAIRDFLIATGVSPTLMRQVLDDSLLQNLGLVRDKFARLGVRQATNLLYRQANFNLLREESEGYSKLITEIFSANSVPPPPPSEVFEKVKALIGTFDLDVGRVLDVTLDVAAAVLIKQFKFFVKFLRTSSWWPSSCLTDDSPFIGGLPTWAHPDYPDWTTSEEDEARNCELRQQRDVAFWDRARQVHIAAFFELGGRRAAAQESLQAHSAAAKDGQAMTGDGWQQKWIKETGTLPASGNRVAAQLLGFKLRFYNSDIRDKDDILPANLLYLSALLIKIGFISLIDLYPHLSPADEKMDKVRDQEMEKLDEEERAARGGQMNALLMAGVLPQGDDDNPIAAVSARKEPLKKMEADQKKQTSSETEKKLPEPLEQKMSLLIQLLTIGAIPESLFILGKFPWIPDVSLDVLQRVHRILHVCLQKVYNESRPWPLDSIQFPAKNIADADQTGVVKGSVRLSRLPTKQLLRWPHPDNSETSDNRNYRFYLDEWSDNIPVCQTVDDVFTLCDTFLNISGVNIGKDEALLAKLASIGAKSLATDPSEANRARWQDLLRRLLLPALSHTKANASVVNAIWELVKQYPLLTRYSLYAEWFEGQISRLPAMKKAFARATSETRATMKRVSLTNLSEMAKRLAKTSYASPGIVFKVAFEQLESYSNLIEAFVECTKYFTDLSYDVLVWSLLNSLGKSRSRTQANHALTTSKWLQALSRFSGKVFRRYPVLNPVPVLQYVDDQLFNGNWTDLIILKEFISSMGGIVDAIDFTDYQILSMAGGPCLRRHTLVRAQDRRLENTKSSGRLVNALSHSNLAARLLINLTQFRQTAIYNIAEERAHVKYLSSTIDDTHQILIQYLDFLWSSLDADKFDLIIPSIPVLMRSYGLDPSLAFLIGRPSLAHHMFPWKGDRSKKDSCKAIKASTDKEGDTKMAESTETEERQVANSQPPAAGDSASTESPQKPDETSLSRTALAVLQPIVDAVQEKCPPELWTKFTPELYTTFWALQLGDLSFPEHIYVKERSKIMKEWTALSNDRSDMTRSGLNRKQEKRKELMDVQSSLIEELSEHGLRKAKWKFYLTKLFQSGFCERAKADAVSDALFEQCFLPRLLLSPTDAEFCFRFLKALHDWNAPVFRLMSFYDRLFNANRLRSLIFMCTVREAEYLGRFLKLILEDLSRWHKNEVVPGEKDSNKTTKDGVRPGAYDQEGKGPAEQPRLGFSLSVNEQGKADSFVEHVQFRDMLFRWHKNLNMALKSCLGGSEWMHIRNAITILRTMIDFFPAVDFMATQFMAQLQAISKREAAPKATAESEEGDRVDLSVAAQAAMSELQKRKGKLVMVQAFRSNAAGDSKGEQTQLTSANESRKAAAGVATPPTNASVEKSATTRLRPTAPDFKPLPSKTLPTKLSAAEEEDGEVQDGRDAKGLKDSRDRTTSSGAVVKENLPAKPAESARDSPRREDRTPLGPAQPSTPRPTGPSSASSDARAHGKLPDRPTHNLPSRPDVPIPSNMSAERYGQQRGVERREARDQRETRGPRDAREGWEGRESRDAREGRESQEGREQRQPETERSGRLREFLDRRMAEGAADGSRLELAPQPGQVERDRPSERDRRPVRSQDRHEEVQSQVASGGPSSSAPAGPSEPAMNPERAALVAQGGPDRRKADADRQPRVPRPDASDSFDTHRAGPISDRHEAMYSAQARGRRDEGHERGSRGQSPRRVSRHAAESGPGGSFDERPVRPYPADQRLPARDVRDRSPLGAPGYRAERPPMDRELDRGGEGMREASSGFHRTGPRGADYEHRLPPHHHDQNYGRLNAPPTSGDVPSGPRGRGRVSIRGAHASHSSTPSRAEGRFGGPDTPRALTPERLPPTGPASGRGRRPYDYGAPAAPTGPSGAPPAGHADRGRNLGPGPEGQPLKPVEMAPASAVHPDRLAQMGQNHPSSSHSSSHGPHPVGHGRHAGSGERQVSGPPRPSHGTTSTAEPVVPTGPALSNERTRNGGGRRQLAGINNMLQQAQSMPDLNRGRSGPQPRQFLGNSDAQVLTGGESSSTAGHERGEGSWQDASGYTSTNMMEGPLRREPSHRGERDSRMERPSRPSRRSSRERDRSPRSSREDDGKEHGGEYRERRSIGGPDNIGAKEREVRRPGREMMGPPHVHGNGRELMTTRETRHRGEGGFVGHRPADDWASNGAGYRSSRGGPRDGGLRPPEERRDGRDERGRKRRSEEGMGHLASEREKRPRRG